MKGTVILNYGCPRSGTTFIWFLLRAGTGYTYGKIGENDPCHPCNSGTGLLHIKKTFRDYNVVFIRTVRNPIQIFESFRHAHKTNDGEIGKKADIEIKRYIQNEERNTKEQAGKVRILTVKFDMLSNDSYVEKVMTTFKKHFPNAEHNTNILRKYIHKNFNHFPVRPGKLQSGVKDRQYLSETERQEIMQWYKESVK